MSDRLIIVMGVSGCGKSTAAQRLARTLDWRFLEADDFHSEAAVKQMAEGIPLTDTQRIPWLKRLCGHLNTSDRQDTVLAYSGLRRAHRQMFREIDYTTLFVLLHAEHSVIKGRIEHREGHFMNSSLLDSQFEALQMPDAEPDCIVIDCSTDIKVLMQKVTAAARLVSA